MPAVTCDIFFYFCIEEQNHSKIIVVFPKLVWIEWEKNIKIMHAFCYNSNNTGMLYKENVNVSAKPPRSSNQCYQPSVMMFYPPLPMLFIIVCKHIPT